jgi:hypothetical protein
MAEKIHYMGDSNPGPRGGKLYVFHCPGCGYNHPFEVGAPNGEGWTWNGSLTEPTFAPSLLVNQDRPHARCHSFVENGKIRFLEDCFHALKNQTVEIPDWE